MREIDIVRLRNVFGDEVESLSEREVALCSKVLYWSLGHEERRPDTGEGDAVARCIKEAVSEVTGISWRAYLSSMRDRSLSEGRYIAFHIYHALTLCPKTMVAYPLGISLHRATVSYGIQKCEDWLLYDEDFRKRYEAVLSLVEEKMKTIADN